MKIEEFARKYHPESRAIKSVVERWIAEKQVRDFLGTTIMAGVTVADLMIGDRLVDTIHRRSKRGFWEFDGFGR